MGSGIAVIVLNNDDNHICLLFFRGVTEIPFGLYEVIFNPVLSDYFGFSEGTTPYFFLGLGVLPIVGGLIL